MLTKFVQNLDFHSFSPVYAMSSLLGELRLAATGRITLAPPGAAPAVAVLAPPASLPDGPHLVEAGHVEDGMVGVMQDLRISTVERNAEVAESYRVVRQRVARAQEQLQQEAAARDAQFQRIRAAMAAAFEELETTARSALQATFAASAAAIPPIYERLARDERAEGAFYNVRVPETIEALSGAHVREMESRREALALDDTTIRAREARIVERLDKHIEECEARGRVEAEDRAAQHARLEKSIREQMKKLEEDSERMQPRIRAKLAELNELLAAETVARGAADAGNLKLVASAMERLQREALMNFGTEDVVREHAAGAGGGAAGDEEEEGEGEHGAEGDASTHARGGAGGR